MSGTRSRAIAWRHRQHSLVCDRVESWAHGTAVFATDLPTFYDYNLLRLEGPDPGADADSLAAVADERQSGLAHRRIEVEDEAAGLRLRPGFEALGWHAERLAWLHRHGPPPERPTPAGAVLRLGDIEASRPLRAAWRGESVWDESESFHLIEETAAARRSARTVIGSVDGEPVGFADYSTFSGTVEIELVFCLPQRRGGGLGGAMVARALAEAAAAEQFIEADDDGDSKRLYERLGFRTVWRRHSFTRAPRAAA